MNVFLAGGSGAIGVPFVRALVAAGHPVTALTRSSANAGMLRALGATPAIADALDADALRRVVVAARPTHVVHELTALPKGGPRRARDLDATNRLRVEGTRKLIVAAVAANATRIVLAEDVGLWSDGGGKVLAARRPVFGREAVVKLLAGIRRTAPSTGIRLESVTLDILEVNQEPAVVIRADGAIDSVYTMSVAGDVITSLRIVRNPAKLEFLNRQLAVGSVRL